MVMTKAGTTAGDRLVTSMDEAHEVGEGCAYEARDYCAWPVYTHNFIMLTKTRPLERHPRRTYAHAKRTLRARIDRAKLRLRVRLQQSRKAIWPRVRSGSVVSKR